MKKLSIITICYNEKDAEKTCKSIVNQTWQDFEWIVIDGGSDQWCVDILKKYQHRMDYFVSEKDKGIYDAMNKGILAAKGEYLNFMNTGDCFYDKQSLQKIFSEDHLEDIVYADSKFLTNNGHFLKQCPDTLPLGWFKNDCLPHQACFMKKELFDKYGLYNTNNKIVSDWEKWIIFIDVNKATYKHLNKITAIHDYTGLSSHMSDQHLQERALVLQKYYGASNKKTYLNANKKENKYIKLFGHVLLRIQRKRSKTSYYLFNWLPIIVIRRG